MDRALLELAVKGLKLACPATWEIAVHLKGEVVQASEAVHSADIAGRYQQDLKAALPEDWQGFELPLKDHAAQAIGAVWFYAPSQAPTVHKVHLEVLVQQLEQMVSMHTELDDMAVELMARHEELNLVYDGMDQGEESVDDEEYMASVLDATVNFLGADFSAISIPGKNIWMWQSAMDEGFEQLELLLRRVEAPILHWLSEHRQPLVVNDHATLADFPVAESLPYRFAAAPIYDHHANIIGGIAMAKGLDRERFQNSDKNLLSTVAARVSTLVNQAYDPLTGLTAHAKFRDKVSRVAAMLDGKACHSLVQVSLDESQYLIERFGNGALDEVIAKVAKALMLIGRASDFGGRLDNGELALLMLHCEPEVTEQRAAQFVEEMRNQEFTFAGQKVRVTPQVGIARLNAVSNPKQQSIEANVDLAFAHAHIAHRVAGSMESCIAVYSAEHEAVAEQAAHVAMVGRVREALNDTGFAVFAQSIVPLCAEDPAPHFEALIRMYGDEGEIISPFAFIPTAEQYRLMHEVDLWMVENTLKAIATSGILHRHPDTVASINLSGQSFARETLANRLISLVRESGVSAHNVCFEVTETATIGDMRSAQDALEQLRRFGCKIALDDFGAGLSSFTYLRVLPLDYVKIDGFFVRDMLTDPVAEQMVSAIRQVAAAMGLQTVAEFVEDEETAERLKRIGVDFGQGYGFDKPMPVLEWLAGHMPQANARG